MVMSSIPAGTFKAKCLELMDQVEQTGQEVVITKHGRPVAKLAPIQSAPRRPLFGRLAGTSVRVAEDAFASEPGLWSALDD